MRIDVKDILQLNSVESQLLGRYRDWCSFNPREYVEAKTLRLAEYCDTYRIDSLTVLVSGGVDSAVVAALCAHYARKHDKKLHLVTIPSLAFPTYPIYAPSSRLVVPTSRVLSPAAHREVM